MGGRPNALTPRAGHHSALGLAVGFFASSLLVAPAGAATILVKTLGDAGPGSLRAAITSANARPNTTIAFAIPRNLLRRGGAVIRPARELPVVSGNGTRIDGTSQARLVGDTNPEGPEVVLDGSKLKVDLDAGLAPDGLVIVASRCRLSGLVVQNFGFNGVVLAGPLAFENRVAGCFLGTDATGKASAPNGFGITVRAGAHHNFIGGEAASARNVISGNSQSGMIIQGASTRLNVVQNNFIGLNASGTGALGNGGPGLTLNGSVQTLVGGTRVGEGNVISGNSLGVNLIQDALRNTVQGNLIGTDASGRAAIPNASCGMMVILGSRDNRIGGATPGARNVLSGNKEGGIAIGLENTSGNVVQGNLIGLDATGTAPLPNELTGVLLYEGARDNLIGGEGRGEGNVIAGNTWHGVAMRSAGTSANRVQGNLIGLSADGSAWLPNQKHGVAFFDGAHDNIVGGSEKKQANIIAFGERAFDIQGAATTGNKTEGNILDPSIVGRWEVGQLSTSWATREWDMTPFVKEPGEHVIRFQYTAGGDRLDIEWAEILENGKVLVRDAHEGRTGYDHFQNEYRLALPSVTPGAAYTLRANVKSPSGTDSLGEVLLRRAAPGF